MKRGLKTHGPHLALHIALTIALVVVLVSAPVSLLALSQQSKAPRAPVSTAAGHVCDHHDLAMQCALPQASLADIIRGVDPTLQGVDFAWSCAVSQARQFGASYLSTDSSKNWSRSCVDTFHAQHKATVAVWESSATEALNGYSAGQADARQADAQIRALGAPANTHIDFAVDFDETLGQAPAVASYFRGVDSILGVSRTGAYGGYYTVTRLCAAHLTTASWATYAWSGGLWPAASCAPLEQYLNSSSVDYDRAIAPYYGQWPYNAPKPPTPKLRCFGKGAQTTSKTCRFVQGEIRNWQGENDHVHRLWIDLGVQAHQLRCVLPYKRTSCKAFGEIGVVLGTAASSLTAQIAATEKKYGT